MAGRHRGGFKNSRADLFKGASMALVPEKCDDILLLERLKKLFTTIGFERVIVTTAEKHDEIIAFTSQMTHLVSNAFIKSDTAMKDEVDEDQEEVYYAWSSRWEMAEAYQNAKGILSV